MISTFTSRNNTHTHSHGANYYNNSPCRRPVRTSRTTILFIAEIRVLITENIIRPGDFLRDKEVYNNYCAVRRPRGTRRIALYVSAVLGPKVPQELFEIIIALVDLTIVFQARGCFQLRSTLSFSLNLCLSIYLSRGHARCAPRRSGIIFPSNFAVRSCSNRLSRNNPRESRRLGTLSEHRLRFYFDFFFST